MKTLLEFFIKHFDFLYLDARYRITDSKTSGVATIDAGLTLTGPTMTWSLANNRGCLEFGVAPTQFADSSEWWFRVTLIRQYLDNYEETNHASPEATTAWISDNLERIEELLTGPEADRSREELKALAKELANKYFGPLKFWETDR